MTPGVRDRRNRAEETRAVDRAWRVEVAIFADTVEVLEERGTKANTISKVIWAGFRDPEAKRAFEDSVDLQGRSNALQ